MAIYGQLTDDKSIQSDSRRWYTLGSGHQRNNIRRMIAAAATGTREGGGGGGNPVAKDDDVSLIFATLLFIHFEICMPTRPDGWMAHAAAENLIIKIGPHACRTHQMHGIFLSVRMYLASLYFFPSPSKKIIQNQMSNIHRRKKYQKLTVHLKSPPAVTRSN